MSAPLYTCEARDPKGLYHRARAGEISNLTGIDDLYEEPLDPDLQHNTDVSSVEECVSKVLDTILSRIA